MAINTGRVVAGGLVAGVVANAIDFVTNTYVLGADMQAWAASHNIDQATLTRWHGGGLVGRGRLHLRPADRLHLRRDAAAFRRRCQDGDHRRARRVPGADHRPVRLYPDGHVDDADVRQGTIGAIVATLAAAVAGAAVYKEEGAATPALARG